MREPVTKFDLDAAFTALDKMEYPKIKRITEGLRGTRLAEDVFDISGTEGLEDAQDMREEEVAQAKLARIEQIVDLDAKTPDEVLPSYIGKYVVQCPQCMTLFYKDKEDLVPENQPAEGEEEKLEVGDTVNVEEKCQHCGNASGYTLVGKIGELEQPTEESASEEVPAEEAPIEEVPAEGEETPAEENTETTEEAATEETPTEETEDNFNLDDLFAETDTEEKESEEKKEEKKESFTKQNPKAIKLAEDYDTWDLVNNNLSEEFEDDDEEDLGETSLTEEGPSFGVISDPEKIDDSVAFLKQIVGEAQQVNVDLATESLEDDAAEAGVLTEDDEQDQVPGEVDTAEAARKLLSTMKAAESFSGTASDVEAEAEELNEAALNNVITESLVNVYDNVASFTATNCEFTDSSFIVEGIITFKSGATKDTKYVFTSATEYPNNKILFEGYNKSLCSDGGSFTLTTKLVDKVLNTASLSYKYKIGENLIEGYTK